MAEAGMNRRGFLVRGAAGAVALGSTVLAGERAVGANERISIGAVGCGGRGSGLMAQVRSLAKKHNVEITAVCDVWKVSLRRAAAAVKKWFGKEPRQFTRFGDLMALEDVDAALIATPDYAHTPVMIAALEADKDVYVEKPMSLEIPLANKALDLARARKRVVQVGTQRRSDGRWHGAHKELATGVLGHISRVSAGNHFNHARWARGYGNCEKEDVDWEAFLFNRPRRPFEPKLLRRWHLYREFTNGLSGLWMSHLVDACHMVTGAEYPVTAVAHGGNYVWKDGREHCDVFHALLDYPEGFLFDWAMSLTNSAGSHYTVHGRKGTLDISGTLLVKGKPLGSWTLTRHGGAGGSKVETRRIKPERSQDHMANWLECLRSRKRPNADIQYGHQHAVATIMAAAALHQGRRMRYDPKKREMTPG